MFQHAIHYLHTNIIPLIDAMGNWFYVLMFLIAVIESTFLIGTFIPGTIVMLFFGFAASQGHISILWTIFFTALGAIVGDFISYYIGRYGRSFIKENKGLLRMSHIEIGKAFFLKHGGKSVILGRFVSPIRQIIPFVAGMVHMSYRRFIYLNIFGAILWAVAYLCLGFYFGAYWRFIDKIVSRIGLIITLACVAISLYVFHFQRERRFKKLQESVGRVDDSRGGVMPESVPKI